METILHSQNGNYTLIRREPTQWSNAYDFRYSDRVEYFVIHIDFNWSRNGNKYENPCIRHGFRSNGETLTETQEYINLLQEAVDFMPTVMNYIKEHPVEGDS